LDVCFRYAPPIGAVLNISQSVGHHLILAHAQVTKVYRDSYKSKQGGQIGITLSFNWVMPFDNKPESEDNTSMLPNINELPF